MVGDRRLKAGHLTTLPVPLGDTVRVEAGPVTLELRFLRCIDEQHAWTELVRTVQDDPPDLGLVNLVQSRRRTPHHSDAAWVSQPKIPWARGHKYDAWPQTIGTGSSATVRKASCESDGRVVAIKYVAIGAPSKDQDGLGEKNTMIDLNHPNITQLLDWAVCRGEPDTLLLVQEYAHFGSLAAFASGKSFSEVFCRTVMTQVLKGTRYLHQHNIIHRDINPANILVFSVEPGFLCKLTDFGQSREMTLDRLPSDIQGTPAYMAMEVALGQESDQKADIYACGKVAFRLLTGYEGFASETTLASLPDVLQEWDPHRLLHLYTELSAAGLRLICKMLDNQPGARPAAARCLEDEWFTVPQKEHTGDHRDMPTSTIETRPLIKAILVIQIHVLDATEE
ncbi:hypothetical protein LTR85_012258 [Meristemomyces frigidus]|nr:hypothetical protein LTR85_012258 [Meristemomyces frigidus]